MRCVQQLLTQLNELPNLDTANMLNAFARDVKAALVFLNTPLLRGRSSVNEWGRFFSTSVSRAKNVIMGVGSHAQPDRLNTLLLDLLDLLDPELQPGVLKLIPASSHDKAEALELVLEDGRPFFDKRSHSAACNSEITYSVFRTIPF